MAITITVDGVLRTGADWQTENNVLPESLQPVLNTPNDPRYLTMGPPVLVFEQTRDPAWWEYPTVYDLAKLGQVTAVAVTTDGLGNASTMFVAVTGGTGEGLILALTAAGGPPPGDDVYVLAQVADQGNYAYLDGDVVTAPAAVTGADADATFTLTVV